jgi:hypothetical protein
MARKRGKARKTAFVPSVVFGTVFAGVVPACVAGCGTAGIAQNDGGSDATEDRVILGVAACCFDANFGVADAAFRNDGVADAAFRPDANDAGTIPEAGVADVAFGG